MPSWVQHILVIALVTMCVAFVAWQTVRSLAGRRGRVGSCCAKGCGVEDNAAALSAKPQAPQRDQFMPVEMLARRR
jgi:hypothetical protein